MLAVSLSARVNVKLPSSSSPARRDTLRSLFSFSVTWWFDWDTMFITCRWLWENDGLHYKASDCNIGIVCMTNTLSSNACREVLHCESTLGPRWPQDWELRKKSIQVLFWYFPESALGALEAGRVEVAKGGDQPLSWKHLMSWWSSLKWEQLKLQLYHFGASWKAVIAQSLT